MSRALTLNLTGIVSCRRWSTQQHLMKPRLLHAWAWAGSNISFSARVSKYEPTRLSERGHYLRLWERHDLDSLWAEEYGASYRHKETDATIPAQPESASSTELLSLTFMSLGCVTHPDPECPPAGPCPRPFSPCWCYSAWVNVSQDQGVM